MSSEGRIHKKYEHIIFFAAGGMGGAVSPPGDPRGFPGRGKALKPWLFGHFVTT